MSKVMGLVATRLDSWFERQVDILDGEAAELDDYPAAPPLAEDSGFQAAVVVRTTCVVA